MQWTDSECKLCHKYYQTETLCSFILLLESVDIGVPVPRSYRRKRRHHRHTSRHSHDRDSRERHHNRHEHQNQEEPCDPDEGEQDSNELSDINTTSELLLTCYYYPHATKNSSYKRQFRVI